MCVCVCVSRSHLQVEVPKGAVIDSVYCGSDSTFFLTEFGKVLACGSNDLNKLGLNLGITGIKNHSREVCTTTSILVYLAYPTRTLVT